MDIATAARPAPASRHAVRALGTRLLARHGRVTSALRATLSIWLAVIGAMVLIYCEKNIVDCLMTSTNLV